MSGFAISVLPANAEWGIQHHNTLDTDGRKMDETHDDRATAPEHRPTEDTSNDQDVALHQINPQPVFMQETVQRVPPTSQSRREFSIKGLPLDHAAARDTEDDVEAVKQPTDEAATMDLAVGEADLGGAMPHDGLPPPLQYSGKPFRALWIDLKRKSRDYRTDWTDAFLPENLSIVMSATLFIFFACLAPALAFGAIYDTMSRGQIGITETLMATGITGIINAFFSGQALTIQGPTGPELAYLSMLFSLCATFDIEFLPAKFWAGLWTSLMTIAYTLLEWCCFINKVTRFTEEIFSAMISLIEIVAGSTNVVRIFLNTKMSIAAKLYSVIIVALTYVMAVKFRELRSSDWLTAAWRKQLANYGVSITIISLTIISSLVTPVFGITDVTYLNVPDTIAPTWTDPTTNARRAWFVKAGGYEKTFPVWAIFFMIVPAIGGCLLGYLDQNLTEVLVNRKDRMFKKLPAYHLSNMVVGCLLYPICALLGLPACHPATVRSLAHVMALTSTEVVPLPDGKGNTVRITGVAEQRVTHLLIHILIFVALAAGPVLKFVPQPIIIGIFLFLGISSIRGNQLFDRAFVLLTCERERWPGYYYVQDVDRREMTRFTILQLVITAVLVAISRVSQIAIAFPFLTAICIPFRVYIVPRMFDAKALEVLDK
ncbi:hypothetical protein KFE25_007752 [Diacronema lutheri]|uniref:Bicarbonate transporter-like transmembrane domain-containing protein n=3 Tax=Diacronema lutheri TaxID=2081491 RepID=A0A8J5Y0U1_DIALT|nr:hypothetical protein KFE25_007752 [Diacronema lutheri]